MRKIMLKQTMFQLVALWCIIAYSNCLNSFSCPDGHSNTSPIVLPTQWINGSINCFGKNAQKPAIEIFPMNNDSYILRENKCINYEAPFIYLLFSSKNVLLLDSGATVSNISFPIQATVETLIAQWCTINKCQRQDLNLIVAHSHGHSDHIAGDSQFRNKPYTTVVGTSSQEVSNFFGISDWPNTVGIYELDSQRRLAIVPIPGHETSSIAIYDCATALLLTGDSLLPGRLYISNFTEDVQSISRLGDFIESNRLDVSWILGAHIEMSDTNQIEYPVGATYQPHERQLNLSLNELHQLNTELQQQSQQGFESRHRAYFDTFIVDPNPSELPPLPPNQRYATHGFVLVPLDKYGSVWVSHKPEFGMTHDFQLTFYATLSNATIDPLPFPTNISYLGNQWTLEPDAWSLNNLINGNLTSFRSKLYLGNFEAFGQYLGDVTVNVIAPLLNVVQLNSTAIIPYQPVRYASYIFSNQTTSAGAEFHFYMLHQIRVQPDFDAIAHVVLNPKNCKTDMDHGSLSSFLVQPGILWTFPGLDNDVATRLTGGSGTVRGQILGDIYSTVCPMKVIEEIQCTLGPDFAEDCNV